jgi:hypothetical protein
LFPLEGYSRENRLPEHKPNSRKPKPRIYTPTSTPETPYFTGKINGKGGREQDEKPGFLQETNEITRQRSFPVLLCEKLVTAAWFASM